MKLRKSLLTFVTSLCPSHLWNLAKSQLGPDLFPSPISPPPPLPWPCHNIYFEGMWTFFSYSSWCLGVPTGCCCWLPASPPCLGHVAASVSTFLGSEYLMLMLYLIFMPPVAQQHGFFSLNINSCCWPLLLLAFNMTAYVSIPHIF